MRSSPAQFWYPSPYSSRCPRPPQPITSTGMGLTYEERIFWKQIPDPKSFDSFQDPKFNFHSDLEPNPRKKVGSKTAKFCGFSRSRFAALMQHSSFLEETLVRLLNLTKRMSQRNRNQVFIYGNQWWRIKDRVVS